MFTLTVFDEPHQVAMQMFLHQLLPEEGCGGEATGTQQTQAANKFQLTLVLQKTCQERDEEA